MQITVREYLKNCLSTLKLQLTKREKWIKEWPSQSCITASEIQWTLTTTKALLTCQNDGNLKALKKLLHTQVNFQKKENKKKNLQIFRLKFSIDILI